MFVHPIAVGAALGAGCRRQHDNDGKTKTVWLAWGRGTTAPF
jgi:hypothetical protein